jgi:hypothetical protein
MDSKLYFIYAVTKVRQRQTEAIHTDVRVGEVYGGLLLK